MSATTPNKSKTATKAATTAAKKKREAKQIVAARAHVRATFNNTMITITDMSGNTLAWSSGGAMGFKGNRKSTPFAAQIAGETVAKSAMEYGVKNLDVFVRGPGSGREAALRAIQATGLTINSIRDTTPVPHNGCRPKKRRRV